MVTTIWTDNDIQQAVLDEFVWDPEVEAADIGVEVDDGVVTLTGTVETYTEKVAAENAAQRVDGVRAIANNLSIHRLFTHNDTDIARDAASALEARVSVPSDRIAIVVQNGKITLRGEVDWAYQRTAAEDAVQDLRGVRGVINLITIAQPQVAEAEVQRGIERALMRAAELDADRIRVRCHDGQVTLSGTVSSWREKREAGAAAWRAKGVIHVTNTLEVRPL